MSAWIWSITVNPYKKDDYYYELDRALEEMPSHTIYQGQSRIRSIEVGDIVYFYECGKKGKSNRAIGWKCRVLAVDVPYEEISDIDDRKFEHNYKPERDRDVHYMKVTALAKYDDDSRAKLSFDKLKENGLNPNLQSIRPSVRPNAQLLSYINSVPSVVYDD